MILYGNVLCNNEYINIVNIIENMKFITNGKWDWEHGMGHCLRVAEFTEKILAQLNTSEREIDLGMTAALLHDIGLIKGTKVNHAIESSKMFTKFIQDTDINDEEIAILYNAIIDHSNGENIQSLVGLALCLADKLDVTYHRTIHSIIQNKVNKEIQKIKSVDIKITDNYLIVMYETDVDFDVKVLKAYWDKCFTIPEKIATHLNRNCLFMINDEFIEYSKLISRHKAKTRLLSKNCKANR